MSSRPQQVSSSNEASTVHQLNSPQDDFASISALRATGTQDMQHGLLGSGLSQDSMSMFSRSSGLPSQELLMRSREGLMNHLPMSMSSSLPSGSMSMGSSLPSTYPAVNSLNPSLLVRDSLINPELQFRGGLGSSEYTGGHGQSTISDADISHDYIQRRLQQRQKQQQHQMQQESRLLYDNVMGSSRNIANPSSQQFSTQSVYSSMKNIPSYGSSGGHLDSSLLRKNQDQAFLLNRSEQGESSVLSNQLFQQMNYQLRLQEEELALRKSQLERVGLNSSMSSSIGIGSFQNEISSGLPSNLDLPSDFKFSPFPLHGNTDASHNQKTAGRSELIFANSSIAGITPSRSTSVETTPNGKVFYFPCRARGMDQGHNFDSAYFTVPDGLDHGADLYCSYRACRAEGCKFRYCAVCKAPAARRNFRKRHGHGEHPKDKGNKEETCTEKKEEVDPQESSHETSEKNISEVLHDATESSKLPEELKTDSDPVDATSVKSSKVRPRPDDSYEELLKTEDLNDCWDKLLISRPDASEKPLMDAWILKVTALNERMNRQKSRKILE
eukprot:CAMPEP_0194308490 /NCGR_PEP_ID=MMETSP0171-20130528/5458_1 /TAXON_ID=218684 /ORGANISM="Corethron pennatum, Strain L29A3" /LENGTH=555 /DNA_ID=CAMNT_0039061165 /DNA_START=54 /DNA_END=1721 /DNA_ORIENTATION=-